MRAVVLAGGQGTRLRPYTQVLPKPLMPVGDRPILDIVVRQLHSRGFRNVTISTGYLAELIEAFFRDGAAYGVSIDYCREREPLGTVGALSLIDDLDEPFLVMNGDVLTDIDYAELLHAHIASDAAVTIATKQREIKVSLGVLEFEDASDVDRLTGYVEKPTMHYEASIGVYCMAPRVLEYIEPGVRLDFPDLVLRLMEAGEVVRGSRWDGYWLDIGRHEDFERANEEFETVRHLLLPSDGAATGTGSMLGESFRL
jgi:NDP-sugar pyrophosphorylase family protein